MPTPSDEQLKAKVGSLAETQGIQHDGFFDPTGPYPRREYSGTQQTNRARQKSSFTGSANCSFFCKALRTVSNTFYISFPLHLKWITTF